MTPAEILEKIKAAFPEAVVEAKTEGAVNPYIKISQASVAAVAQLLRDDKTLGFDYLDCLSGVDYGKNILGVVYNLSSIKLRHKITIKVEVPKEKAELASVSSIWPTANWHEREAYDLIGINFIGHPDLRRILMPEDWEGHPLRKDYKVPEFYQGMKVPY